MPKLLSLSVEIEKHFLKKNAANIITFLRIICSALLLLCKTGDVGFYILLIAAGTTDMLDGFIARKTGNATHFGEVLDSIADFCLAMSCAIKLFCTVTLCGWQIMWLIVITLIRATNAAIGFFKFGKPVFLHTRANKLCGAMLFLSVLDAADGQIGMWIFTVMSCMATFASAEEGYLIFKLKNGAKTV